MNPLLVKKDTRMRNAISLAEQPVVTLRFLATGESFTSLQYEFRINKGSPSIVIPKVCKVIYSVLSHVTACPSTTAEWFEISHRFLYMWQLPNCLGEQLMANISGFYILLVLALIILITKATSVLCSWQLWVPMQSLFFLMCSVPGPYW